MLLRNSWELYGFDYMVDTDFNAWLIEINSSPACDYSTKVTGKYVQKALVELLSVTLDCREWDNTPKKSREERPQNSITRRNVATGLSDIHISDFIL